MIFPLINLLAMGHRPRTPDESSPPKSDVSPWTTYSIPSASMAFFEAHRQADQAESSVDEVILTESDFVIWQTTVEPLELDTGLRVTVP